MESTAETSEETGLKECIQFKRPSLSTPPHHSCLPKCIANGQGQGKYLLNNTEEISSRDMNKTAILWPNPGELSSVHSKHMLSFGTTLCLGQDGQRQGATS